MKTFTMIARCGKTKDVADSYVLMSSDYQTIDVDANTLAMKIQSKEIIVNNMGIENGKLTSTNGAIEKYTFINAVNGQVDGTARAVIIDRVEKGGKLIGYTVFTHTGQLIEANVSDTVALCNKKLISNGKIRHTQDGDIVSAIGGQFNLREIPIDKAPKGVTTVSLMFFGKTVNTNTEYFGAIVACTSAAEMHKISEVLSKSNAQVIGSVVKVAGQSVRNSLGIKRCGANSLYGVFSIDVLEKLVKVNAKVECQTGNITVSSLKYKGSDGDFDEALIKMNKQLKVVDTELTEDNELNSAAKEFASKIAAKFNGVNIK